ncbi:MAG: hypothetical protein AAF497_15820 [Planctomycetota bacterium]
MGILRNLTLIAIALTLTQQAIADAPRLQALDVVMTGSGELVGHIVNAAGKPVGDSKVILSSGQKMVGQTETNERGAFRFKLPSRSGGSYVVSTAKSQVACRVWMGGTEPPAAKRMLLLTESELVRGQYAQSGCNYFGNSPWANNGGSSLAGQSGDVIVEDGGSIPCDSCGECGDCGCHGRKKLLGHLRGKCCGKCCGGCGCIGGGKLSVIALGAGIIYMALDEDNAS